MDCTLHLIDEKQYREIYVPAVAGDEAALNQLLEWASLLSAGWESRSEAYRLVKELRGKWKAAVEAKSGGTPAPATGGYGYSYGNAPAASDAGRTIDFGKNLNYVYGVLSAFRRPAFYAKNFSFSTLSKVGLGDLATFVVDARMLLDGVPGVPPWMPATATGGLGTGATSGLYLPKDRVVPFLKALRSNLKGFGEKIRATGHDAEEGLAWLISACVDAKEIRPECGILELQDAYAPQGGRAAFPAETARAHATNTFPRAVIKEIRKAMGTLGREDAVVEEAPKPAPKAVPAASSEPPVPYSPQLEYKVGQRVTHKRFGTGEVKKILDRSKVVIAFNGEERTLAQNAASGTPSEPRLAAAPAESAPAPASTAPAPSGDPSAPGSPAPGSPAPGPSSPPLPPTRGPRFQESSTDA